MVVSIAVQRVPDMLGLRPARLADRPVDRCGKPHHRADHAAAVDLGLLEHLVDEAGGGVKPLGRRAVDVELAPGLGEDGVGEVGDGDPQVAVAEVDRQGEAGGAVESDHHPGAPGVHLAVGQAVALDREAGLDQVADDRRDRRAREVGRPGELGAAREAAFAQRFDHAPAVAFPQRGK